MRGFLEGHLRGIQWVYNHTDLLHEDDLEKEYPEMEPYVSLNQTETALKGEFDHERMSRIKEIQDLKQQVARLAESSSQAGPSAQSV